MRQTTTFIRIYTKALSILGNVGKKKMWGVLRGYAVQCAAFPTWNEKISIFMN